MKLAIMQPYFFPYIGYYQAIASVDKYILYDNLSFIKEAWMNRNRILLRDGRVQMITVPLCHKSSNSMIRDIEIDSTKPWKKNLLATIHGAYCKAPYYDEIIPVVSGVIEADFQYLKDLNNASVQVVSEFLGLETKIETDNRSYLEMEEILSGIEDDYSALPYLTKTRPIRKVARVLEMCRQENAEVFHNAIGGQELYSKSEFAQYGIDLHFVKTDELEYQQCARTEAFVPNLSIIDVLMNNGREGTRRLLDEYTLV